MTTEQLTVTPARWAVGDPVPAPTQPEARTQRRTRTSIAQTALTLGALAVLFDVCARAGVLGSAVPPISSAIAHIVENWGEYRPHLQATCGIAVLGLVIGGVVGLIGGVALAGSRLASSVSRGLLVVTYCAPSVVLLPILVSAFSETETRLLVITMMIAYPLATAIAVGLETADPKAIDLIRASGGGRIQELARIRLPHAAPDLLAGLQVAFPAAILGAMLAELAGGRRGLGLYLIAGVSTSNSELVWGVGWLTTGIAATGYVAFGAWGKLLTKRRARVDSGESAMMLEVRAAASSGSSRLRNLVSRTCYALIAMLAPLTAWWAVVRVLDLNPIVMKGPQDVWSALTDGPRSHEVRNTVLSALGDTLTWTAFGFAAGLLCAVGFAILLDWRPGLRTFVLPPALLSQTVPLVAMVPILLVTLGRGRITLILIGVIITFFPAFVMISRGLVTAPGTLADMIRSSGGSAIDVLVRVKLPHALPYLTAAARLLAPRALLGIILGEFIATGTGLGFVIYEARGTLDYATMWVAATAGVLASCFIFWLAGTVERQVVRRFAGQ